MYKVGDKIVPLPKHNSNRVDEVINVDEDLRIYVLKCLDSDHNYPNPAKGELGTYGFDVIHRKTRKISKLGEVLK